MRTPLLRSLFFVVVGVALVIAGCTNGSNHNPVDQITGGSTSENGLALSAAPAKIVIDPADPNTPTDPANGNKRYGESVLTAIAHDPSGAPQPNLELTFTASAGRLSSATAMTDDQGVAHDTLRVYEDDPGSIDVSVTDGTRTTAIVVTKIVAEPPVANAGPDQIVECTGNSQAAVHLDGSGSTDPNGDITLYEWFENFATATPTPLGTGAKLTVSLSLGSHVITLRVTDATGKTATDDVEITVVDTQPPRVDLSVSPASLWPPNHRMVDVHATVRVDDCQPTTVTLVSVTSNEPDNGLGDGDTVNDIQGADTGTADTDFQLRAERAGGGSGRVYTIVYKVVDAGGLETSATAWVRVPHDQSGR